MFNQQRKSMKKISTFLLAGAAIFGLAACNNEKGATPDEGTTAGNTSARVTVSLAAPSTLKAQPQVDEAGRAAETKITSMHLIGMVTKDWTTLAAAESTNPAEFWKVGNAYTVAPFEATAGTGSMAMALNKGDVPVTAAPLSVFGAKATAIEDIAKLSTDDKFVMTSASASKTVTANVTKETAKNGSSESDNVFKFNLERVVAQAFVSKKAGLSGDVKDGSGVVDLTKLTYSVMNGASTTYVLANQAGERQMQEDGTYKDFKSVIHTKTVAEAKADNQDFLIRIGALGKAKNEDLGGYKAIPVSDAAYVTSGNETKRGIYFLENSSNADYTVEANRKDGYTRLATAKVYGTFAPKDVYDVKAGAKQIFTEAANTNIWYKKTTKTVTSGATGTTTITYTDRTISVGKPSGTLGADQEWVEGRVTYEPSDIVKLDSFKSGKTFYVGSTDNAIYASIEAALSAGNKMVKTYLNGRCGYYGLLNRTKEPGVKVADTRRNNIYALAIASFASRGFNWDPIDPKDPNLPKPDPKDPDQDPTPDHHDFDIEKQKGFMRCEATVLQWNLVTRDVNL